MARVASTTTPLAGGAQWPDASVISNYLLEAQEADRVTGSVFADQTGTLFIEQSPDGGQHWDVSQSIAVTASTGQAFSVEIVLPWVRVRYVNGATPQTAFRLYAKMNSAGPRP